MEYGEWSMASEVVFETKVGWEAEACERPREGGEGGVGRYSRVEPV